MARFVKVSGLDFAVNEHENGEWEKKRRKSSLLSSDFLSFRLSILVLESVFIPCLGIQFSSFDSSWLENIIDAFTKER